MLHHFLGAPEDMPHAIYHPGSSQTIVLFCHVTYVFDGISPQIAPCNMKTVCWKSLKDLEISEGRT